MKTYIIAEVGPNHNGSLSLALKYVDLLSKSGADAVKFQLAKPHKVYSLDAFKAKYQKKNDGKRSIIEMSKKINFLTAIILKFQNMRRGKVLITYVRRLTYKV